MTMRDFIKNNRGELHACIDSVAPQHPKNDGELQLWINNDESLYLWAKREGVKIWVIQYCREEIEEEEEEEK